MSGQQKSLIDWVGSTERVEDMISLTPALGVSALLNRGGAPLTEGSPLPPLWQWFYFLPQVYSQKISLDGHPERGGFMPPVALPRRMFAGSRMKFFSPLFIGGPASRHGEIIKVVEKSGKTGNLVFVTVKYQVYQGDKLCIEEEQDIVYKEAGGEVVAPTPLAALPTVNPEAFSQVITPNEVMLFRFSALTFNAHRIHYDRPYAMEEEGYPGLVVHGPLTAIMLAEMTAEHSQKAICKFTFQGRAPLFDKHAFRLVGEIVKDQAVLESQGPDGKTTMKATAELE
jgi:3-methylfumaryl-CoA hydratase